MGGGRNTPAAHTPCRVHASAQGLEIDTISLPRGITGLFYLALPIVSGGVPPYAWSLGNGNLPPGLSLSGTSGAISGTPTTTGIFPFTLQVVDSQNNMASQQLRIAVSLPLLITTLQLPNATQGLGYETTLSASGGVPPYTWGLVSGSLPAGLTLNTGSGLISGTPSASGTSSFMVRVTDSLMSTAEAALQIVVNPAITNALLNGHYAFSLSGFQNGAAFIMAAAFTANGQGQITGGKLDVNYGQGEPNDPSQCRGNPICPIAEVIQSGSTYDLSAGNGLGAMTIATIDYSGNPHTYVFSIAVSGNGCTASPSTSFCGSLIERDPAHPNTYGSGVLKVQDSHYLDGTDFFPGNFAVLLNGVDPNGARYAAAGVLATNPVTMIDIDCNGNGWGLNGCPLDVNDNGATHSDPVAGGQFAGDIDSTTGRGWFVNVRFPSDPSLCSGSFPDCGFAYYIINRDEMILISSDALSRPANLTLWAAMRQSQSAGWNLGALNGTSVMRLNALDPNGGKADISAGLFSADGNGSASFSSDENDGGVLTPHSSQGTYSLDSSGQKSGRVVLSGFSAQFSSPPVLYLFAPNSAFVVGTDAKVNSGVLEPQSGAPFSNASVGSLYAGATVMPVLSGVTDSVTSLFADADGNIMATQDTSGPGGPGGPTNFMLTYQVDSTGRALVRDQSGNEFGVLYVIGPNKFALVPSGNTPGLVVFATGGAN